MRELEEKILSDGIILPGNILKVGGFLNQQIDINLCSNMAKEVKKLFSGHNITKILTIEASGIPLATMISYELNVPLVVVKKHPSANLSSNLYSATIHSYTHGNDYNAVVDKSYLNEEDKILIVDDFLASGNAIYGLMEIIEKSGASLVGCAVAIEKKFQNGGDELRAKGIKVESLAIVDSMSETSLSFYRP